MFVSKIVPTCPAIPANQFRTEGPDAVYSFALAPGGTQHSAADNHARDVDRRIAELDAMIARWHGRAA